MGRRLEFDKDAALLKAMESFWAKGYEATSMRDLAERLGLHLGSVYNALGDKESVFESALRLHYDEYVLPKLEALSRDEDPMGALDRFMDRVVEECGGVVSTPGCFIINSLIEINSINSSISNVLKTYLGRMEDALVQCVRNGIDKGQVDSACNARACGRFIMSMLFSMRTMGKLNMPPDYIRDIKTCAVAAVRSGRAAA